MTSVILNELKGATIYISIDFLLTLATGNSESETSASSSVGDSAHKFVDLFRGLQQDVKEMKAELVLGKAEKIQEQEVHKAELSKLATLLMLEQEDRKVELSKLAALLILEQEDRKAECEKLTYQITKLKKEKKVVQTRLKLLEEVTEKQGGDLETLESSLQQCKKDLAESIVKAKAQQHADMQAISEVRHISLIYFDSYFIFQLTVKLIPIHLRVLLDRGREKILKYLLYGTWDDLSRAQAQGENNSLSDMIMQGLGNIQHGLSQEAVKFLCTYDNIRRDGNHFAHASEAEIKNAVETKSICSQERRFLEQLYEFVFNVSV